MTPESPIADLLARLDYRARDLFRQRMNAKLHSRDASYMAMSDRELKFRVAIDLINEELQRREHEKGA